MSPAIASRGCHGGRKIEFEREGAKFHHSHHMTPISYIGGELATIYLLRARPNMEEILIDFLFCYLNRTRNYGYSKVMSLCFVSIN